MTHRTKARGMTGPDRFLGVWPPARSATAATSASRKTFLDRLGLPEDATKAEFQAALDEKLPQKRPRSNAGPLSDEETLYDAAWGNSASLAAPKVSHGRHTAAKEHSSAAAGLPAEAQALMKAAGWL